MNVIDFMNLTKAYQLITTVLAKNIDTGDQDETEYINNIKLKDISEFLQEHQVIPCPNCTCVGTIFDKHCGKIKCPTCNGNGGYFKEEEIECYL